MTPWYQEPPAILLGGWFVPFVLIAFGVRVWTLATDKDLEDGYTMAAVWPLVVIAAIWIYVLAPPLKLLAWPFHTGLPRLLVAIARGPWVTVLDPATGWFERRNLFTWTLQQWRRRRAYKRLRKPVAKPAAAPEAPFRSPRCPHCQKPYGDA